MPVRKHKVLAYITHGERLLVFRNPLAPEAGIQVPAGTVEEGEDPEAAVLREAVEETGLHDLTVVGLLGEQERDMAEYGRDEIHHRRFYHLRCTGDPPSTWRQDELHPSDGGAEPIPFDFFWARLPDEVPDLIADQGAMLPRLLEEMRKDVVRTGYDAIASQYLAARHAHPLQVSLLEDFAGRLPKGARVLDAGCGAGDPVARTLSERFAVTGVDISEEQIRLARQIVPQATFLCQDMTALDFPDESFEGICSLYAVIHVPRVEHGPLLRSFHRLLKPGGLLLLCMGSGNWPGEVEEFYGAPMYWSHYDAATNRRMTEEVGFHIVRSEMVPDTLDPEIPSRHVFLLAEKREASR